MTTMDNGLGSGSEAAMSDAAANGAPSFAIGDGIVTTDIAGSFDYGQSVTVQADGGILVAGFTLNGSDYDFALVRYNADGSLDTGFGGGDGIVTTDIVGGNDYGRSVTVQADGGILVAGYTYNGSNNDFALMRYNADGSLDTSFGGGDGIVTTDIAGGSDQGYSVTVQADGGILVAGRSGADFALVRYNADGSLDTGFGGGDGIVTTDILGSADQGRSMTVQADGGILVAGYGLNGSSYNFALVRYNPDGSLDTSFGGGDGIVTTDIPGGSDQGTSVTVQADGGILVAGRSGTDFALVRYNADGSLDTSFGGGDGIVTTDIGTFDEGTSVVVQADGGILVAGGGSYDFALVRYNADGSRDTSFGDGDGIVTTDIAGSGDIGYSMTVQADGAILVAGYGQNVSNDDFALVRYNADGSLDTSFDARPTLGGTLAYVENGAALVLDDDVAIRDGELDALNGSAGDYAGATLVLARAGGASAEDVFDLGASGACTVSGNALQAGGQTFATMSQAGGVLTISFTSTGTEATTALARAVMQAITYANASDAPPASVDIAWTFSDGNSGSQGSGGALSATGTTTVAITAVNDAPSFAISDGIVTTDIAVGNDAGQSVAVQADGGILVAGYTFNGPNNDFALMRYNADGSLDTGFGGGDGIVITDIGGGDDRGYSVTVQADGGILVAGHSGSDFALVRYNADGSLDTSFGGGGGIVTTDIAGNSGYGQSVTIQADGGVLVAGYGWTGSSYDFVLVRYNADGSLDTGFGGGDGIVTTDIAGGWDRGYSVTVQGDGGILVAGGNGNDFALVRYNADGSLDTSFGGGDGIVTTDIAGGVDFGQSVTVQADGGILVAGSGRNGSSYDFVLVRYNVDGSLDTSFGGGDGIVTTDIAGGNDYGRSVTVQGDGGILVAGYGHNGSNTDFALMRYNADGSLDTSFGGGDGIVTTDIAGSWDSGHSVTVQADGSILVAGSSGTDFALVRYNADGSLDTSFDARPTLGGTLAYVENGAALVLDDDVAIRDGELDALNGSAGDYAGATLVLARAGGASAEDVFDLGASGACTVSGNALQAGGQTFATMSQAGGVLTISFTSTGTEATTALARAVMQAITYANASDAPPASVDIAWTFSDGNSGSQGSGGALSATGTTTVAITAVNDAPTLTATGASASFTEGGSAADLFSGVSASTVETGQTFSGLTLTVSNVTDGAAELLTVDGLSIALTNANTGTTVTNGLTFAVSVVAGTATVTLSGGTLSAAQLQTLVDALAYRNSSDDPTAGPRTVTLASVTDSGGTASGGVDTTSLAIGATVTVAAVNDAPTLTATGATASFTEGGSAADLFSGVSASTVETGQTFSGLTLTVSNVTDGAAELLTVDGTSVGLTNGNSGTTVTNSLTFAVSVVAGTATLTLSGGALSAAQLQTLVDALAYRNSSDNPTAGARTVTLASLTDSGGTASGGVDTTSLAIGATVTVAAVNDDPTARDDALGTLENAVVTGSVFADNGNGVDLDVDGGTLTVTAVNGVAVSVGQQIALASGALLTLNANGTFSYDPNGAFNALAAAGSGAASGLSATDSFGYEISDGQGGTSSALATVTITGVDSAGDLVTGSTGNDVLDGGIGADTMIGGTGDDTYVVDDAGDVVSENAGEGQDVVYANASYVLAANIESLVLYGNGSINGTGNGAGNYIFGNAFANVIDGGGGADVMIGSAGNDTYIVDHVDDVVGELAGEGDDTVQTSVNYGLHDHVEFLIMTGTDDLEARGNALANTITGNAGDNAIDGGAGTDVMAGGAGNDRYAVDNIFDRIVETAGNGDDTVYASVDHQLDAHVETLIMTGTAVRGFGSDEDNRIFGNDQVNVLYGRGGSDYMFGGAGDDIFVITAETGTVDVIGDFTGAGAAGGDRLSFSGFGAGATVKQLSQTSFEVASADGLTVQQFILAGHDGTPLSVDDYYWA